MLGQREQAVPDLTGEHDVFAHYADAEELMHSRVYGTTVTALCGKVWVPWRDPNKYPMCPTCLELRSAP